ncbi:hypothetical protein, partial [Aeromonas caviae]|uniref:hypothetical protein n=1 Tax=Aeromonas caviae TaxID=648 RepID=UPI001FC84DB5
RHFNALQLVNTHQVSYKPFHNQLRKESFALFMKALVASHGPQQCRYEHGWGNGTLTQTKLAEPSNALECGG